MFVVLIRWFDIGFLLLKDSVNRVELQTLTQATPVDSAYIQHVHDQTPSDYDLRWSGLAVTVGEVIASQLPHVDRSDWHQQLAGVSRQELIYLAAKSLASIYKQRLPPPL